MSFIVGFIIGLLQVGAVSYRMVSIIHGNVMSVATSSMVVSLSYYVSTMFIFAGDIKAYIGFSLGAAAVTCVLAHKNKKELNKEKNND